MRLAMIFVGCIAILFAMLCALITEPPAAERTWESRCNP